MQVTEPAQSTLRQGDRDWALFSLLSDSDVSYMMIPFDIFESVQAAHVKCIQSIVITDVDNVTISRSTNKYLYTSAHNSKRKTDSVDLRISNLFANGSAFAIAKFGELGLGLGLWSWLGSPLGLYDFKV